MTTSQNKRASFSSSSAALRAVPYSSTQGESRNFDLSSSTQNSTAITIDDPPYLSSQLKSSEWLQRYGLKSQRLTFDQILQQIGYKKLERITTTSSCDQHQGFVPSIGKTVGAKYTGNLYHEVQHDNGDHYILTCRPEKLREFRTHLERMLTLLRKRLAFITSGSRRVFGMIGEPSICFVCDCKSTDHRRFNQFQTAVTTLLKEQVSKIKRFNIIWVSNDKEHFQERPIDVTPTTIDQAIDWISCRKCPQTKISISATCEAILKAFTNPVHSIYLISEGESSDSAREILRDNIVKTRLSSNIPIPIHVVSLFCHNNDTETFLRSIAQTADGSFISYKIHHEKTDLKPSSNVTDPTGIKMQDNTLKFGTNTAMTKPEQPVDLSLMYKEINQCHSIIDRLDKILGFLRDDNEKALQTIDTTKSLDTFNPSKKTNRSSNSSNLQRGLVIPSSALFNHDESEMASIDWLKVYGIDAQKLDIPSVLQPAAFRHCDGVVTVLNPPDNAIAKYDKTPANPTSKLINAKYCDQFAHITWSDGTIRHVFVTTDMQRDYERRIRALLDKVKARLTWLKKGSRDLFGTIVEKNIYILIDTSISMRNHLDYVKDKLRLLIQDQLFTKERINMVAFNTITNPWRDRLTKVNDPNTTSQLQPWIDELHAEGSTNTLAALRFALADPVTEAIYLLTDGRPDQSERHILSQVQYRQKVPIHTIAFNCHDQIANQFLIDLSKQTGGRFHAFNYGLEQGLSPEIPESEDVMYLKQELARGGKDLQRIASLRDECTGRAWSLNSIEAKYKTPRTNEPAVLLPFRSQSSLGMVARSLNSPTMPRRLARKKCSSSLSSGKPKSKPATQVTERKAKRIYLDPNQWLLPETEQYLRKNVIQETHRPIVDNPGPQQGVPVGLTKKIPTPLDETISYLKKNNVISKGLTIFDVLHPTTITVKVPAHVQVFDRYVLAKVWDDILPLAYGSYVDKLRLVNHYAVDLKKYETNLDNLIDDYGLFTSKLIWTSLNDEDKEKIGPNIYWLSLSEETQYDLTREITEAEHVNRTALELFAWRKLSVEERTALLRKPVSYHEKTREVLKNALKNAEAEATLQGVALMDAEIKRARKFLKISTDLRQHQIRAGVTESKPKDEPTPGGKKNPFDYRNIGRRVLYRYDPDGYFYPGTLYQGPDGRLIILFDMEIELEAIGRIFVPIGNSNNNTNLFLNDAVLVRQMRGTVEYWAPGLVMGLPSPFALPPNLYMIQIQDPFPKQVYAHRKDMSRITMTLFQRSSVYLQTIYRNSASDHYVIINRPTDPPSHTSCQHQFETIIRTYINPLTEKVDRLSEVHYERYLQLLRALEDQMRAIRILQERSRKQPGPVIPGPTPPPPPPPPPPPRTPTPPPPPRTPSPHREVIRRGTEVYAVWSDDDGLVYKGVVIESNGSDYYIIERIDFHYIRSRISRRDIFLESDLCLLRDTNAESFALIEYPNDSRHCFCPSVIFNHDNTMIQVRFYDCVQVNMSNNQHVILISKQQFEQYTKSRIEKEKSLVNQVTVGLNKQTNTFMLGTIKKRVGNGHQYLIEWYDGTTSEQSDEHLFHGVFTPPSDHRKGDYVLAVDINDVTYKPARVVSKSSDGKSLKVEFIHFTRTREETTPRLADVPSTTTFFITQAYYNRVIYPRFGPVRSDPQPYPQPHPQPQPHHQPQPHPHHRSCDISVKVVNNLSNQDRNGDYSAGVINSPHT